MKIISVVGARPNFIKIAPFKRAIEDYNISKSRFQASVITNENSVEHILVHTGQHYDDRMSEAFFQQLGIKQADINLGIGSGSHSEQVGLTMIEFEKVLNKEKPDWVVIVGDVNAILACSVTSKKENIKCCHIEAGLRSGDMSMPEEINRLVADRISDLLLTPDPISTENLLNEGIPESKIRFVGNIMIDTLDSNYEKALKLDIGNILTHNHCDNGSALKLRHGSTGLRLTKPESFAILTLHRPSNVDDREILTSLVKFLINEVVKEITLIWTLHPRTKKMLLQFGLMDEVLKTSNLVLLEPVGYLEMLKLNMNARIVLTDSGGLQEECTVLGTPCLTMRRNTERPITLRENGGTNVLVGNSVERIRKEFKAALVQKRKPVRPDFWDGHTAGRCLQAILDYNVDS